MLCKSDSEQNYKWLFKYVNYLYEIRNSVDY
jgi:hypothetical protein